MSGSMNCREALALLYDIIDKEASEVDTEKVQEHIKSCGSCSEIYRVEGEINKFLKARMEEKSAESAHDNLKNKITSLLDQEDGRAPFVGSGSTTGTVRPLRLPRTAHYIAAAAALVLMVWGAFVLSELVDHYRTYYDLEQAHFDARANITQFANAEQTALALEECQRLFDCLPGEECAGMELVGGKLTELKGAPAGHFVYTKDETVISVYIAPANEIRIPDELRDFQQANGEHTFFDHHCRGCRLVYRQVGDVMIVTATEDHSIDLFEFTPESGAI